MELEQILEGMQTDAGRALAIYSLNESPEISNAQREWAGGILLNFERFKEAGLLFEKAGDAEKAIEIFSRHVSHERAGNVALSVGLEDRAMDEFRQAVALYAIREHSVPKALRLIERTKTLKGASREYGRVIKAMEGHTIETAARLAAAMGMTKKALGLFRKAHKYEIVAQIYQGLGRIEQAIRYFTLAGDYGQSAALCRQEGQMERAVRYYVQGEDLLAGADCALEAGRTRKANSLYKRAIGRFEGNGDYVEAAQTASKIGMAKRSRDLYMRAIEAEELKGNFGTVVKLAEEAGMLQLALPYATLDGLIKNKPR